MCNIFLAFCCWRGAVGSLKTYILGENSFIFKKCRHQNLSESANIKLAFDKIWQGVIAPLILFGPWWPPPQELLLAPKLGEPELLCLQASKTICKSCNLLSGKQERVSPHFVVQWDWEASDHQAMCNRKPIVASFKRSKITSWDISVL